jgi:uncharacterized small protein (DUF1192 family)
MIKYLTLREVQEALEKLQREIERLKQTKADK